MKKRLLILAATAALLASAPAVRAAPEGGPRSVSTEDLSAFTDARVAGLKAGLKLTPDQEKNWPGLETAIRDVAKARIARFAEWRAQAPAHHEHPDAIAALHNRAQRLTAHAGDLEKLAQAAKPLYDTLDEGQKRRFGKLMRAAGLEHMRHAEHMMREGGHEGGHDHDPGHDD
jgi:LTXXQ motif family protein